MSSLTSILLCRHPLQSSSLFNANKIKTATTLSFLSFTVLSSLGIFLTIIVALLGEFDHLPEVAFYMVGDISEAVAKAERLAEEVQ